VLQCEADRRAVRGPVEPALRQERVHADDHCECQRKEVDRADAEREPTCPDRLDRDTREGDAEQNLLPRLNGSESAVANPRPVQRRHDGVVCGQADNPRVESDDGPPPHEDRARHKQEPVDREREPRSHGRQYI
jgi:hypothetical protein